MFNKKKNFRVQRKPHALNSESRIPDEPKICYNKKVSKII